MRTTGDLRSGDLTARSRIISAALSCFGRRGYDAATVRDIAAAAGTSAALLVHHFGGKQGLAEECDRRVIDFLTAKRDKDAPAAETLAEAAAIYGRYLARRLSHPGGEQTELFDGVLRVAREAADDGVRSGAWHPSDDPEALALAVLVMSLAPFMFAEQVERWAGGPLDVALVRLAVPLGEIYSRGLFTGADTAVAAPQPAGHQERDPR